MSDGRDLLVGHEGFLYGRDGQFLFGHVHLKKRTGSVDNSRDLSHRCDTLRRLNGHGRLDVDRWWSGRR